MRDRLPQKTHQRYHSKRRHRAYRSHSNCTNALRLGAEARVTDVGVNRIAERPPSIDRPLRPSFFDRFYRAIGSHPGHHLGVGESAARSAHLPNALRRVRANVVRTKIPSSPRATFQVSSPEWKTIRGDCGRQSRISPLRPSWKLTRERSYRAAQRALIFVARQPGRLEFGQAAFHRRYRTLSDLGGLSGNRPQQPCAHAVASSVKPELNTRKA